MTLQVQVSKKNTLEFTKIKNFYTSNYTTNKVKRQPTESVKIFANHTLDDGLASRVYKELL